ncbi:MAG: M13 family peptidase [Chitinophagia bacterium]|jgi:putative endopeptidase|nr:M13 family peptidase [Chitinophagia bacterium]
MKKNVFLFIALLAFVATACNTSKQRDILAENIDTTINPADDFFAYANGFWLKHNPIPGDETSWGIGQLVNEEIYSRKLKINEAAAAKSNAKGIDQQIGDFWKAAMDTVAIEKQGISPLQAELAAIQNTTDLPSLLNQAAKMHAYGVGVFFGEGVSQDAKNSELMSYQLWQGGLGLPSRDYFFNTDERSVKIKMAYTPYVKTIFTLMGTESSVADKKAQAIVAFEEALAKNSRKLEALRDPYANYNKMSIAELNKLTSAINWQSIITTIGLKKVDTIIVGQPEFLVALNALLKSTDIQTLKDYMSFHLVNDYASYLSAAFANAKFDFYGKVIRGAKAQRPRWKRVLDAEEGAMGEALGQLFAKEYFNETAKKRYEDMVENVRDAYKARIEKLTWMTDSTKQKALAKLSAITKKVGYPEKWKDFSSLKIDASSFALNMMRSNAWWNTYSLSKYGKPVDRTEWDMTPQTYNAYYNPSNNEIVLPAGIFTVPGFRDEELDDALVYGYAAASTIGHEITHGFDDEGRQFDAKGNLKNWWSTTDEEQFTQRAQKLVNQFSNMIAVDTMHINGKQTLGENLADLGGLLIGLDAFKLTDAYKAGKSISGYTPLQRFFLGYALGWMYSYREESIASQIVTDVHAPAKQRVNGPMPNIPEFYEAFKVTPKNKLYLPDSLRVQLW